MLTKLLQYFLIAVCCRIMQIFVTQKKMGHWPGKIILDRKHLKTDSTFLLLITQQWPIAQGICQHDSDEVQSKTADNCIQVFAWVCESICRWLNSFGDWNTGVCLRIPVLIWDLSQQQCPMPSSRGQYGYIQQAPEYQSWEQWMRCTCYKPVFITLQSLQWSEMSWWHWTSLINHCYKEMCF